MSMKGRRIEDVVNEMLSDPETTFSARHVHIFRKEYDTCLIRDCGAKKAEDSEWMNSNT